MSWFIRYISHEAWLSYCLFVDKWTAIGFLGTGRIIAYSHKLRSLASGLFFGLLQVCLSYSTNNSGISSAQWNPLWDQQQWGTPKSSKSWLTMTSHWNLWFLGIPILGNLHIKNTYISEIHCGIKKTYQSEVNYRCGKPHGWRESSTHGGLSTSMLVKACLCATLALPGKFGGATRNVNASTAALRTQCALAKKWMAYQPWVKPKNRI